MAEVWSGERGAGSARARGAARAYHRRVGAGGSSRTTPLSVFPALVWSSNPWVWFTSVLGVLAFGPLAERILGSARTVILGLTGHVVSTAAVVVTAWTISDFSHAWAHLLEHERFGGPWMWLIAVLTWRLIHAPCPPTPRNASERRSWTMPPVRRPSHGWARGKAAACGGPSGCPARSPTRSIAELHSPWATPCVPTNTCRSYCTNFVSIAKASRWSRGCIRCISRRPRSLRSGAGPS